MRGKIFGNPGYAAWAIKGRFFEFNGIARIDKISI
jgi:hypothetical protein